MPRIRKSGDGGLYYDAKRKLWVGVFDNGLTPEGRRKQVRVTSRSQSKAREKLMAKKAEFAENYGQAYSKQTVNEWADYWLESVQQPIMKPGPFRAYRSVLKVWIRPEIGTKKLVDVRASDLRRIYDKITVKRSDATALKAHVIISSMFESARLERIVPKNVAEDIKPPKVVKADRVARNTFEPDVTYRVIEETMNRRHPSKWLISLDAGIRQGERLGATIDSVDLVRGTFTVQWNLVEGNYVHGCDPACGKRAAGWCPSKRLVVPQGVRCRVLAGRVMLVPPKSGEPRTFPLLPGMVDMLANHIAELSLQPNPHGLLWPASDGSPMTSRDDQAEWRDLINAAGVENDSVTTHWARHTAISDMSAAGISASNIGGIVGHKSPGVTGEYTHQSSLDAFDAMRKLQARRALPGQSS